MGWVFCYDPGIMQNKAENLNAGSDGLPRRAEQARERMRSRRSLGRKVSGSKVLTRPSCPASPSRRGQRRTSLPGIQRGSLPRWSVGTITRSRVTGLTEKGISVAGESRPTGENRKRPTVLNETGRWSVRGSVPTLERGNDQKEKTRLAGGQSCTARGEPSSGFLLLPVRLRSNGHPNPPT